MSFPPLLRWIPAFTWLRAYNGSWLRGDVLAGITLAAYLLPAALGDASLANLLRKPAFTPVCSAASFSGSFAVRATPPFQRLPPFRSSLPRRLPK